MKRRLEEFRILLIYFLDIYRHILVDKIFTLEIFLLQVIKINHYFCILHLFLHITNKFVKTCIRIALLSKIILLWKFIFSFIRRKQLNFNSDPK